MVTARGNKSFEQGRAVRCLPAAVDKGATPLPTVSTSVSSPHRLFTRGLLGDYQDLTDFYRFLPTFLQKESPKTVFAVDHVPCVVRADFFDGSHIRV